MHLSRDSNSSMTIGCRMSDVRITRPMDRRTHDSKATDENGVQARGI
jgi:hypothetical protein